MTTEHKHRNDSSEKQRCFWLSLYHIVVEYMSGFICFFMPVFLVFIFSRTKRLWWAHWCHKHRPFGYSLRLNEALMTAIAILVLSCYFVVTINLYQS